MDLTQEIVDFALLGAEWVLWLLMALSVISVAVMIERVLFLRQRRIDLVRLERSVVDAIRNNDHVPLEEGFGTSGALAARVGLSGVKAGLAAASGTTEGAAEAMNAEKARIRKAYEERLVVLATLGNNAPFIGLFGTVLGIVAALHDLAVNPQGGAEAVVGNLKDALVATAVGLIVAVPAVIAFNLFNRRVRAASADADTVAHVVLAELHRREA
jgi:biopolymer transport protein ExbB